MANKKQRVKNCNFFDNIADAPSHPVVAKCYYQRIILSNRTDFIMGHYLKHLAQRAAEAPSVILPVKTSDCNSFSQIEDTLVDEVAGHLRL